MTILRGESFVHRVPDKRCALSGMTVVGVVRAPTCVGWKRASQAPNTQPEGRLAIDTPIRIIWLPAPMSSTVSAPTWASV